MSGRGPGQAPGCPGALDSLDGAGVEIPVRGPSHAPPAEEASMLRSVVAFVLGNIVTLFMFTEGLARRPGEIRHVLERPALYVRSLLVVLLVVPLVALAVVEVFRLPTVVASAILLMAVCPGAPLQVNQAKALGANPSTSINLLLLLSVFALISVPAWVLGVDRLLGVEFKANPELVFRLLAVKILPPLAVGIAVRYYAPNVAKALAPWCSRVFSVLLLCVAVVLLFIVGPRLIHIAWLAILALVVLVSISIVLGHWAGGPRLEDRKAVALATAFAHPVLAMTIIIQSYPNYRALEVAGVVGAYIVIRLLALTPYKFWVKRQRDTESSRRVPPGGVPA
nr:bile acid:sodium symporter [Myxococcus sp. CA039A]